MNRKTKAALKIAALVTAFALLIGVSVFFAGKTAYKAAYPCKYTFEIEKYADEYDVPRALLFAVIHTESGFDPNAVSSAGALGLTQITPETFHWLQTKTGETLPDSALYEPEVSVRYGALFYSMLLSEFGGDIRTAAAAYHAGRGQVNAWLRDGQYSANGKTLDTIPSRDTNHYVYKVMKAINIYNNLYEKELNQDV